MKKNKNYPAQFLSTKVVRAVYQGTPTTAQLAEIDQFFKEHRYIKERDNFKRYAHWLLQGKTNWKELNSQLKRYPRQSVEYYQILYSDLDGSAKFGMMRTRAYATFENTKEYWIAKGKTLTEATKIVSDIQKLRNARKDPERHRQSSPRCKEYWIARGHDDQSALAMVSSTQARDLNFYIRVYGTTEGKIKYNRSIERRKSTWEQKDKTEHANKTLPKTYNPLGQEIQAIRLFIDQNNLQNCTLFYGAPVDQFSVNIPDVGIRRYDLAVFECDVLRIIFEFHGIGHVNFSEYDPTAKHEKINFNGKQLSHLGIYGQTCYNDYIKKDYIEQQYPDAAYCVAWTSNLTSKDLKIDSIKCKPNAELPFVILPDGNIGPNL